MYLIKLPFKSVYVRIYLCVIVKTYFMLQTLKLLLKSKLTYILNRTRNMKH